MLLFNVALCLFIFLLLCLLLGAVVTAAEDSGRLGVLLKNGIFSFVFLTAGIVLLLTFLEQTVLIEQGLEYFQDLLTE